MTTVEAAERRLSSEYVSTLRDLTSGTLGGMFGIFIGQPLDRVKVLSQTAAFTSAPLLPSAAPASAASAAVRPGTWATLLLLTRREGFLSLWKGVAGPLVGAAPLNALAFAGNGKSLRYLDTHLPPSASSSSSSSLSSSRPYSHYFLAGCMGGFTQTIAATPAELVKCRLQIQLSNRTVTPAASAASAAAAASAQPSNAFTMCRHIYQTEGLRGFFRGFTITAMRDVPSYGVYFLAYEYCKDSLLALPSPLAPASSSSPAPPLFSSPLVPMLLSGAAAGMMSWFQCYPIDVVKSVIQTTPGGGSVGMLAVAQRMYAAGGWRCFFRGLSPTLLRSVPVNAVTFAVFEYSQKCWDALLPP